MFCCIATGALYGIGSKPVQVEVDTSPGLPCFQMVGYLGSEVREARERVRVALKNSGIKLPPLCINVNLSPADLRKEGTAYDLPVAIGILFATEYLPKEGMCSIFILGELGLDGSVKPVRGVLSLVREAKARGFARCMVPKANQREALAIGGMEIVGVSDLGEAIAWFLADEELRAVIGQGVEASLLDGACEGREEAEEVEVVTGTQMEGDDIREVVPDFADVKGQLAAKRAAEIAAAGFHHLLMIGPPGGGKSMIASRIPGILPPLTKEESLEVTTIHSVAGLLPEDGSLIQNRPFVDPHHTVTGASLVGGGNIPRPGLISRSHLGVLFLDELAEFRRETLDLLRQPLEEKRILVSRSMGTCLFPADFMLVAATNPCPCGYFPDRKRCRCTEPQIMRYLGKITGPILDRIDLCCEVRAMSPMELEAKERGESSAAIRARVIAARERQLERFEGSGITNNSGMNAEQMELFCHLSDGGYKLMESAFDRLGLSARSYHRILRVARTIADLEASDCVREEHVVEAIGFRQGGSDYWRF